MNEDLLVAISIFVVFPLLTFGGYWLKWWFSPLVCGEFRTHCWHWGPTEWGLYHGLTREILHVRTCCRCKLVEKIWSKDMVGGM